VGRYGLAVAEDRHGVGDLQHLVQLVRNHDQGDTLFLQLEDQVQKLFAVVVVQGRGGLVEDQELDLLGEGAGDLDQLLLTDAELADDGLGLFLQPDVIEVLLGLDDVLIPIYNSEPGLHVAQENILVNGKVGAERQFLMDDREAFPLAVLDACVMGFLAFEENLASIAALRVYAGDDAHQRRLASAVFAA